MKYFGTVDATDVVFSFLKVYVHSENSGNSVKFK